MNITPCNVTIRNYINLQQEVTEDALASAEFGLAYDLLYFGAESAETPKYDLFVRTLTKKGVRPERASELAKMVNELI